MGTIIQSLFVRGFLNLYGVGQPNSILTTEPDQSRRPDLGPRTCSCGSVHLCQECRESTEHEDDYNEWRCTIVDDDLVPQNVPCGNALCAASCRSTKDLSLSGEWGERAEITEYAQYPSDEQQPQVRKTPSWSRS